MQIADRKNLFEADLCCPQQIKAKPICLKLKLKSKLGIQIVGENFKSAQKCSKVLIIRGQVLSWQSCKLDRYCLSQNCRFLGQKHLIVAAYLNFFVCWFGSDPPTSTGGKHLLIVFAVLSTFVNFNYFSFLHLVNRPTRLSVLSVIDIWTSILIIYISHPRNIV